MKRFYNEFWEKLTEDQQAKLIAGSIGFILFVIWIILLLSSTHIV
jgi:DMSO/TMAO reductase YedYZ heme-binding membrane subunit